MSHHSSRFFVPCILVLFFNCRVSVTPASTLSLDTPSARIVAQIHPSDRKTKVKGSLIVWNKTQKPLKFSNRFLHVMASDSSLSRTYVNAPYTATVDFATCTIAPGDSLVQSVYWMFESTANLSFNTLVFDECGLASYEVERILY